MPKKYSDATPGMKLLGLYWLLLFTGKEHTLSDLSQKLECSKQTVLRLMTQIEASGYAYVESWVEGGQRWYRIKSPRQQPRVSLSSRDIQNLLLCRDLVWHLLPDSLRDEIERSIGHATTLLHNGEIRRLAWSPQGSSQGKGTIDYTEHRDTLDTIRQALDERRVCRVKYCSAAHPEGRTYFVAPLRIVAYRESLSVWCWRVPDKGEARREFDTHLSIHRIEAVELTDRTYELTGEAPDFSKTTFGVMVGEPFKVKVAFSPNAAMYVRERIWSEDQVIQDQPDGGVVLEFTATSEPEVISWVLSFGAEARLVAPTALVEYMRELLDKMAGGYRVPGGE